MRTSLAFAALGLGLDRFDLLRHDVQEAAVQSHEKHKVDEGKRPPAAHVQEKQAGHKTSTGSVSCLGKLKQLRFSLASLFISSSRPPLSCPFSLFITCLFPLAFQSLSLSFLDEDS
jgi:hypothetical protein